MPVQADQSPGSRPAVADTATGNSEHPGTAEAVSVADGVVRAGASADETGQATDGASAIPTRVDSTARPDAAGGVHGTGAERAGTDAAATTGVAVSADERVDRSVRRRTRRWRVLQAVGLIVLLLAGYYLVTLWQVWSTGRSDQVRPVDAIVVLGAAQYDGRPSPQLAARLDHVVELWPQGLAPTVVVTGGNQPGDRFTEAEASAAYLVAAGVPESSILLENTGSTTYESMEMVAAMLDDDARVLIVTDPYHALRSRLTAQEVGLTAYVSPTGTSVVTGGESFNRHIKEAGGIAVGRVIGFERLTELTD